MDESVGNVSRKRVGAQGEEVRRLDRVREDEQVMCGWASRQAQLVIG